MMILILLQNPFISSGVDIQDLLELLRNASSQKEANLQFKASLMGTNMTEAKRMEDEDSGFWANYAINYASFLKNVSKVELVEFTKLTGSTVSYQEYLWHVVMCGIDTDGTNAILSLLQEMGNSNATETAEDMLIITMMVRVAIYRAKGEVFYLPNDTSSEKGSTGSHLSVEHQVFFYGETMYAVYELFGHANESQLRETAMLTNNSYIKHIIALREVGIQFEVKVILDMLRRGIDQIEAEISFWWFVFEGNLAEAMQLRRKDLSMFYSVLVSKLNHLDLLNKANEGELEEIGILTGFTILKNLCKLGIVPKNNTKEYGGVEALLSSLRDAAESPHQLGIVRALIFFGKMRAEQYYVQQEGGDLDSIELYPNNHNIDLADILYQADETQFKEIGELLHLKDEV